MDVTTYNFPELINAAREEFQDIAANSTLSPLTQSRIRTFLESYIYLFESNRGWHPQTDFTLRLDDMQIPLMNDFNRIAAKTRLSTGELFNILMKSLLEQAEITPDFQFHARHLKPYITPTNRITVSHKGELAITRHDLEELDIPVSFSHIRRLIFGPDIPESIFLEKIHMISHCRELSIPQTISKLTVLGKTRFCTTIQFQ